MKCDATEPGKLPLLESLLTMVSNDLNVALYLRFRTMYERIYNNVQRLQRLICSEFFILLLLFLSTVINLSIGKILFSLFSGNKRKLHSTVHNKF
jgi:hypothetical protein